MDPIVVCVLKSGEFRGRQYSPDWVRRLQGMVQRHLEIPHRFVCFTDQTIPGVHCILLDQNLPGWWSKIEMFRWSVSTRLLYLDLDVLVTGPLEPLINYPAPMALMPAIITTPKPGMVRRYQSSVMVWTPPEGKEIFESFNPDIMDKFHGDQDWIGHIKPNCPTFPPTWFCKLSRCHGRQPPNHIKVVLAQHPMSNDKAAEKYSWIREVWREGEPWLSQACESNSAGNRP